MAEHTVGDISEIPEGEGTAVDVNGIEIAVFNLGDGEVRAILNRCAHKGLPMHEAGSEVLGRELGNVDAETCSIQCPWHNLEWDLEDGYNPVLDSHISVFDAEVRDNGDIVVEV